MFDSVLSKNRGPIALFSVIACAALLSAVVGTSGCASHTISVEAPMTFAKVIQVTVEQVSNDYKSDAAAADAKYKGQRLSFSNVEIEGVHTLFYQSGGAINTLMTDYFTAGMLRFELIDYRGAQQRVQVGFILNLDGVCQGLQGGLVNILDCWAGSVKGDLGIGQAPVIGY